MATKTSFKGRAMAKSKLERDATVFATYLRETLIPDLRDIGMEATCEDFETAATLIEELLNCKPGERGAYDRIAVARRAR